MSTQEEHVVESSSDSLSDSIDIYQSGPQVVYSSGISAQSRSNIEPSEDSHKMSKLFLEPSPDSSDAHSEMGPKHLEKLGNIELVEKSSSTGHRPLRLSLSAGAVRGDGFHQSGLHGEFSTGDTTPSRHDSAFRGIPFDTGNKRAKDSESNLAKSEIRSEVDGAPLERNRDMGGQPVVPESPMFQPKKLDALKQCLDMFKIHRKTLGDCYNDTNKHFEELRNILGVTDEYSSKILFMSQDDRQALGQVLAKDPVILVVGQTNCGKTSLVNEILQGSYLPTSEIPCTSRLVRTKFSESSYVAVKNENGKEVERKLITNSKRVPEKYIVLDGDARGQRKEVQYTVEVGIDNDLLGCGVEIIDAPGMCENEALDLIVQECLDGILQLLIYVIDGNASVREQDRAFLYYIKRNAPKMKILFVCNKVEEDEHAAELDRPSDESDIEDDEDDIETNGRLTNKGSLAFRKLQDAGLIDAEETMETCDCFHAISCRNVRLSRRQSDMESKFLTPFQRFLETLMNFFQECVHKYLQYASSRLLTVQKRTFDFFVTDEFLKLPRIEQLPTVIQHVVQEETGHFEEMKHHIGQQEAEMIGIITKYLHTPDDRNKILKEAENIEFLPIRIGDEVQRNHLINECRKQVRDFVLLKVTKDIEQKIRHVKEAISRKFKESFKTTMIQFQDVGHVSDILQEQLECNYILTFDSGGHSEISFDSTVVKEGFGTKAFNVFENVRANVRGIYLDGAWKRDTAKAVLRSIDAGKLAATICNKIFLQLKRGHQNFTFAMKQILILYQTRKEQTLDKQQKLLKQVPSYATNICVTEALHSTLKEGFIILQNLIGEGSRGKVFLFRHVKRMSDNRGMEVAKLFIRKEIPTDFAKIYNYLRLLPKADCFVQPTGVALVENTRRFAVLLPKVDTNLFDALAPSAPMRKSLHIERRLLLAMQIVSACDHAAKNGFRLTDLRPNNISLLRQKEGYKAKLHVIKWKDVTVPYPDGLPAFHFAPEAYSDTKQKVRIVHRNHDAYSMGIIIWLLSLGEFMRPAFAQHDYAATRTYVTGKPDEVGPSLMRMILALKDHELLFPKNEKYLELAKAILEKFVVPANKRGDIAFLYHMLCDVFKGKGRVSLDDY